MPIACPAFIFAESVFCRQCFLVSTDISTVTANQRLLTGGGALGMNLPAVLGIYVLVLILLL